jgi:type I restriction enzyme S subunit
LSFASYPAYKESGITWLRKVPELWHIRRIRWLCQIKKRIVGELGYDVLSITQRGIRVKDLEGNEGQLSMDYSKYQLVEPGDFAMNHMDLLTGWVDISDRRGVTSPDYRVFSLRDPSACNDRYLLYLLQMGYSLKVLYAYGQGSSQLGRWRLPTQQFNELRVPLPGLIEQAAIVEFLDRENAKIAALITEQERLVELLQEKRQAIISHAVTKGLNRDVTMKPSGLEWLGDVPAHWNLKRIKQIVRSLEQGWSPQCEGYPVESAEEWGVLKVGCVNGGKFRPEENKALPRDLEPRSDLGVMAGDLLVSRANTRELVGSAAIVPRDFSNLLLCDKLYRLRVDSNACLPQYLGLYLGTSVVRGQVELAATGASSSMLNIGQSTIMELHVALPSVAEQAAIASYVDDECGRLDSLAEAAYAAVILLQERRSALISAAVTGQIDVRGLVEPEAA